MISHLIFLVVTALYYLFRTLYRAVFGVRRRHPGRTVQASQALETLAAQYGGTFRRIGPASWECVLPDGTHLTVRRQGRSAVLSIQIPEPANYSITFQRLPRLPYAFLEAFLPDSLRIGSHPYLVTTTAGVESVEDLKSSPGFSEIFEALSQNRYSLHMDGGGMRAWKRMSTGDANDIQIMEQVRWLREFARICLRLPVIPVHAVPSSPRCAYCREDIPGDAPVTLCASCGTPHHDDCFRLNGKCSVFGCNSVRLAEAVLAR